LVLLCLERRSFRWTSEGRHYGFAEPKPDELCRGNRCGGLPAHGFLGLWRRRFLGDAHQGDSRSAGDQLADAGGDLAGNGAERNTVGRDSHCGRDICLLAGLGDRAGRGQSDAFGHFTPADTVDYTTASASVLLSVVAAGTNATYNWLPFPSEGLYHSTDSGASFIKIGSVSSAPLVGFGMAAPGAKYPAVYIVGTVGGVYGFFRSIDEGNSWTRINDDAHQYGYIFAISGDPRIYGRVYLGTGGRGILYGDIAATGGVAAAHR